MNSSVSDLLLYLFLALPGLLLLFRGLRPSWVRWWMVGVLQIVLGAILVLAVAILKETPDSGAAKVFALFFGWAYALIWFLPWLALYGLVQWWRARRPDRASGGQFSQPDSVS